MSSENPSASQATENTDFLKLFPERRGNKHKTFMDHIIFGNIKNKYYCERKVADCFNKYPLLKLMKAALESKGCPLDLRRHLSCENCLGRVTGGYDSQLNQIVVCQNKVFSKQMIMSVLAHEMIHMFDYCRANLDFTNAEHVACTEIRAAAILHCSFLSAMLSKTASPFKIAKTHMECVKEKAYSSLIVAKPELGKAEALYIINKVFDKCYNDLEPIGKRIRRNSNDMKRAYMERHYYGYF